MSAVVGIPKVRENGRASSSPGLSSPPTPSSPTYAIPQSRIQTHAISQSPNPNLGIHLGAAKQKVNTEVPGSVNAPAKKPRKKRDPSTAVKKQSDSKTTTNSPTTQLEGKETAPKIRKPRAPPGTGTTKRKSKNATNADDKVPSAQLPGQSKITDSLAPPAPVLNITVHATPEPYQSGKNEAIAIPQDTSHNAFNAPTPRSSGQNYDPVRSSTVQPRSFPPTPSQQILRSSTPPRPSNFGSASNSPSISSLMDPPPHMKRDSDYRALSPPPKRQRLTPPEAIPTPVLPSSSHQDIARHASVDKTNVRTGKQDNVNHVSNAPVLPSNAAMPMEAPDNMALSTKPAPVPVKRKSTTTSGTSTPVNGTKPARQKETMPIVSGNGLLSTEMFGGGGPTGPEKTAPTVILDIPLDRDGNKCINFARMAEERYGFNALYPRLAAQRERLARVAAAGAALEKDSKANGSGMSGDEMSVDLSEGEGAADDSNVEMGGTTRIERDVLGGGTPAEGSDGAVRKRKKRVMKEDQYDKDDPFVDDTELAWEEQAAASKDGFFVYSGPLVPEGEKPNVERADGTTKRGRGTGRGRGGSTRGSRGGATRGRGGATGPRKPRMTKAAKETMDLEKVQRESLAQLAAKPTTYPI